MGNYTDFKIYTCTATVTNEESISIDYTLGGFVYTPYVVATVYDENVNVFVSDLTTTTATLNFSAPFTGTVGYIVRERK
jgi:hypothetical protein